MATTASTDSSSMNCRFCLLWRRPEAWRRQPQPGSRRDTPSMSALGQKQTWEKVRLMSALPPKADIRQCSYDVRFVPKADILRCSKDRYSITSSGIAAQALSLTLYNRHFSSMPFNECSPASSNLIPEPDIRSFTVREIIMSPALAVSITRAAI